MHLTILVYTKLYSELGKPHRDAWFSMQTAMTPSYTL